MTRAVHAARWRWLWSVAAVVIAVALIAGVLVARGAGDTPVAASPTPTRTATATPTPTPAPTPTPTGFPENTQVYDLAALPRVDVFAVIPALAVDDQPDAPLPGLTARARTEAVPVFASPQDPTPVAALPRDDVFEGTTVAVVEQQPHWARVLLVGRVGVPSSGVTGQTTGWVRAQDVDFGSVEASIDVDLTARTVDIVHADGSRERVATDFASGGVDTPTPRGRFFVMMVRSEPSMEFTRGAPIVYLSVQSPTLDGFDGADVAVTALHYHDERSGEISNGCVRLDDAAIARLAQLPLGTPVSVH